MATWTPEKRALLDALAAEILHNYGRGRRMVAVDGADDAGTRAFADDLAAAIAKSGHSVFRASVAHFHRPRAERQLMGEASAVGQYRYSFDYPTLRRVLVEPFRLGGSAGFVTAAFDADRDVQIDMQWQTGPADAVLVVDGVFLNRPELRGLWSFSVWLDGQPAPRWQASQQLYQAEAHPRDSASAIYENSDPAQPRRIFADSC